jgi:hypothetical protein
MADTLEHVHELVNRLPPAQLAALAGLPESILEHESIGEGEERAVEEARQWLRDHGGKGIPNAEVLADFGLSEEDFWRMGEEQARRRG